MKTTITQAERWQLIGLLTLAAHHSKILDSIRDAAAALTESNRDGHVADAIYDDGCRDADALLGRLNITVVDEER